MIDVTFQLSKQLVSGVCNRVLVLPTHLALLSNSSNTLYTLLSNILTGKVLDGASE